MKKALFTALLAALSAIAQAQPYPQHDMSKLLQPSGFNMQLARQVFNDLSKHAIAYPPRFDNAADQQRAAAEAKLLAELYHLLIKTQVITPKQPEYTGFLGEVARANAMAHNLDVPNAAQMADKYYQAWIARLNGKEKARARRIWLIFGEQQPHRPRHHHVATSLEKRRPACQPRARHRLFNERQHRQSAAIFASASEKPSARQTNCRSFRCD